MNTFVIRIICLAVGYACGSIQSAYFYGKMTKGIDIREHGSGNAGTTNTIRVLGTKAGVIVLLADAVKVIIPMLVMGAVFGKAYPDLAPLFKSWTFLGAVLGHDYPFYMNFKGGKGVACLAGFAVAYDLRLLPLAILLFFVP
ncbi:MAG: glycerol-3-phosphate acyltransferase, partial [Lachnospiraceae bacterium]|nr:glycerol-3-phosphate acyltransferase [Lachnospiraceae bacterium]